MNRPSDELGRYDRQMLLPGIGREGQERLAGSHAVMVGCGALGTVAAEQLARAGVGVLTLIDRDVVEWTNLQRQVLFREADAAAGVPKAVAAAARLAEVNSAIRVRPLVADVNPRTVEQLLAGADVVIDGTDNFQTRYLVNDACVKHGWTLVYGGVVGTVGMTMTVVGKGRGIGEKGLGNDVRPAAEPAGRGTVTRCLRCVFPEMPEPGAAATCDTAGVLGPMVGVVASIQAAEAIKVLLGRFDLLRPVLSQFDIWNNVRRTIDLSSIDRFAAGGCVCCVQRRFEFLDGAADEITTICGTDSVQVLPGGGTTVRLRLEEVAARLAAHGEFEVTRYLVRGVLREWPDLRLTVFGDGRAMVHGTGDGVQAKSLYARFVGA